MADATEYCDNEGGGTWTDNAEAWDGEVTPVTYAVNSSDEEQTWGNIGAVFTNISAIPAGSVINAILVEVYCYGDSYDIIVMQLRKESIGRYVDMQKTITPLLFADRAWMPAGSADLWGEASWDLNDIQLATFGVRATYFSGKKAQPLYIGSVRITVTYTPPPPVTNQHMDQII